MNSSVTGHTAGDAITVMWWGLSGGTSYDVFTQYQDGYESAGDTNLTFTFTAGGGGGGSLPPIVNSYRRRRN